MSQLTWLIVTFWALAGGIIGSVVWMMKDQHKIDSRLHTLEDEVHWEKRGSADAMARLRVPAKVAEVIKAPLVPILGNDYESKHRSLDKNDHKDPSPRSPAKHRK